jgi:hypothetical protein
MTSLKSKRSTAIGVVVLLSVMLLGATVWQFTRLRSASAVAAFREVPEIPADADRLTTWMPDRSSGTRKLDLPTRRAIEATYVRGWTAMNRYAQTQESGPIDAWFVGPARDAVLAIPRTEATPVWSLGHQLELRFLGSTGTMVSVRDHRSRVVREIGSPDGAMVISTDEQFDVVFTMEQGAWRIRHLRRIGGQESAIVLQNGPGIGVTPTPSPATWTLDLVRGAGVGLKDATANTLNDLRTDDIDTIRVVLPFAQGSALASELKQLERVLDLAEKQSIQVIVSLFDGRRTHQPTFWPGDEVYLKSVVERLKGHRALSMWELSDKPERDDAISSPLQVRAWLAHTASVVRSLDPVHPTTIAWESLEVAADPGLAEIVDVVSVHTDSSTSGEIREVVAGAAGKPVIVVGTDGSLKRAK